jgi:hypothetical protein
MQKQILHQEHHNMRYYNILEKYEQVLQNMRKSSAGEPTKTAALDQMIVAVDAFVNYFTKNNVMKDLMQNPDANAVQQQQTFIVQALQQADTLFKSPEFATLYSAPSNAQTLQVVMPQLQNLSNSMVQIGQFIPVKAQPQLKTANKQILNALKVLQL